MSLHNVHGIFERLVHRVDGVCEYDLAYAYTRAVPSKSADGVVDGGSDIGADGAADRAGAGTAAIGSIHM